MLSSSAQLIECGVARHRADVMVGSFCAGIADWRGRLVMAASEMRSGKADPNEVRIHLRQLYAEVRKAYADFRFAILRAPPHRRIDDIHQAFHQLLDDICSLQQSQLPLRRPRRLVSDLEHAPR
jgi:hypothetical protein